MSDERMQLEFWPTVVEISSRPRREFSHVQVQVAYLIGCDILDLESVLVAEWFNRLTDDSYERQYARKRMYVARRLNLDPNELGERLAEQKYEQLIAERLRGPRFRKEVDTVGLNLLERILRNGRIR